jgi:hypothetical protein
MPGQKRIGKRDVVALVPGEIVWDAAVSGFGARRQTSAAVTYILKYRTGDGRQRWHTIGRHGAPWTPDSARKQATMLLGSIARGSDPSAEKAVKLKSMTVADLCNQYVKDVEAGRVLSKNRAPKKASTLAVDKGRINRHIIPLLGKLPVSSIKRIDVERFLHDVSEGRTACTVKSGKNRGLARVSGGKTAANRAVGLLGGIFTYAVKEGLRPDNPTNGVTIFADRKLDRRLSTNEYKAFGAAVDRAAFEGMWPPAAAVARFLLVTGWRRNEATELLWNEVDLVARFI